MKELREILRELREDMDLTQSDIADYLGVSQQSYSNYENGNRSIPIWVVVKLSSFYKVSTDYLLGTDYHFPGSSDLRNAYLNDVTMYDVLYDIQKFDLDNRKDLLHYIDYLKQNKE